MVPFHLTSFFQILQVIYFNLQIQAETQSKREHMELFAFCGLSYLTQDVKGFGRMSSSGTVGSYGRFISTFLRILCDDF